MSDLAGVAAAVSAERAARERLVDRVRNGASLTAVRAGAGEDAEVLAATRVVVLCEAFPGVGKVAARRTLGAMGIAELAGLGQLDDPTLAELDGRLTAVARS